MRDTQSSGSFWFNTVIVFSVLALALYVLRAFWLVLVMAGVFAAVLHYWHLKLVARRVPAWLSALSITLFFLVVIVVPIGMLTSVGMRAAVDQLQNFRDSGVEVSAGQISEWLDRVPVVRSIAERLKSLSPDMMGRLSDAAQNLAREGGLRAASLLSGWLQALPSAFLALLVLLFGTFSLLISGTSIAAAVRRYSFFKTQETDQLIRSFVGLSRSVVLAAVLSGFAQSVLFTSVYWIAVGENVALVGFIVFVASFLPAVGAAPVTFGLAAYAWLGDGSISTGLVLAISAAVVGVVDNFVRPLVLKGAVDLHPLVAILAVLGGLQVFGFSGIFLGPIVVGMSIVLTRIWLESTLR